MFNWFRKKQERDCECEEYCPCPSNKVPRYTCLDCSYYKMIDSGYGYCTAMPKVVVVPWCRIICSLFQRRKPKQ